MAAGAIAEQRPAFRRTAGLPAGPLQLLVVQPTPFCNIDCRYCYLADRANPARMSDEVFGHLLDLVFASPLARAGFRLVWHGGEPLAAGLAALERQVGLLAGRNRGRIPVHLGIQTNATLIDAAWAAFFRRHDVHVGVSIDGPAVVHDAARRTRMGRGTFEAVLRGVAVLRDADIPFDVIAVVSRTSLDHADELVPFFAALGARSVGFNVEEIEGANAESSLAIAALDTGLDRFWRTVLASGERLDRPLPVREIDDGLQRIACGGEGIDDQRVPLRILSCDWQGGLSTFSPELAGARSVEWGDFVFRHLCDLARLEDLAELPVVRRLAARIAAGVDRCRDTCPYFRACGGGVPANKFFEHGDFAAAETFFCRASIQAPLRAVLDWTERVVGSHPGGIAE